nr:AMP-binding protein [Cupriavidus sp. LEh25]
MHQQGVEAGDVVVIYMPVIPEALIAMLACARIGATHCVVFGGFAANELATRLRDTSPKAILTASCGFEAKRVIPYKETLREAIHLAAWQGPTLVYQRKQVPAMLGVDDIDWEEAEREAPPCPPLAVPSTHPLYILHTSGTTGAPKGIVRDTGGYMTALLWSMRNIYGCGPGDVFWAASDVGWVVGHSYMTYGPLLKGCTTVLYEGKPVGTPDNASFWRVIERHRVNVLFCAPTALRAIRKADPAGLALRHPSGGQWLYQYNINSLRAVFLAGERCDSPTANWAEELLGRPVLDHWWQTEAGWSITAATPAEASAGVIPPGAAGRAMPGWDVQCVDDDGQPLQAGSSGNIVCGVPLPPGAMTTIWNAHDRYVSSYFTRFDRWYDTGDAGFIDPNGYVHVMGRTDDVINVAGHRLSTGAIEEVVAKLDKVAECAVVGMAHPIKGQVPIAFVVLRDDAQCLPADAESEAIKAVRDNLGAIATMQAAFVVDKLPKTRSGKILRRTLLQMVDGIPASIPATIEDASVVSEIERVVKARGVQGESIDADRGEHR